ncbi:MAG: succinate dehydrogenase, cytochrome b556 subunit [Dichotomicrobium sp.]
MWRIYSVDSVLFLLHRLTGIGLFVYLLAHIYTISTAMLFGPAAFDAAMRFFAQPEMFLVDVLLFGSLVFHAVNGIRLIAHERGWWLERADMLSRATVLGWLGLWGGMIAAAVAV